MNVSVRFATALLLSTLVGAGMPAWGAEEKPAAAKEGKPVKKAPVDYRGPLPAHYAQVLSPDEKEKLYTITGTGKPVCGMKKFLEAGPGT